MKKAWLPFLLLIINTLIFSACKKNSVTEQYTETVNPVIPDFATQVNAAVNGFITDENGAAVQGATVKGGAITVTTDQFGYFKINAAAFAKSAGFVQITKAGYFTGYRTFLPTEGKETFIRLQLIPKTITGSISATTGGTITTTDGAKVTLPANAVINASTNAAYTGTVSVAVHWLNPTEENKTQLTMPGNLTGVDSAGFLNILVTYGMLAVELTGSGGELLQIAAGKKASLNFPIPVAMSSTAPASIPLWYFDETKGLWIQDGNAVKNGSNYEGDVSHFSFWNCDIGYSPVAFTVQLLDSALRPLSNIGVAIRGTSFNSYNHGFTDTSGYIYGFIPANSDLTMEVDIPCRTGFAFKNIHSTNSNIDLGSIQLNAQGYSATIQGIVNKCNGSPVTDGYVILTGTGSNSIININNGSFTVSGIICPATNATVIAIDRETSQVSNPQNITLNTGVNNLADPLTACSAGTGESVYYTDGSQTRLLEAPQYMFTGNYDFAGDSTLLNAIDLLNNNIAFQASFHGHAAPGSYPLTNNYMLMPVAGLQSAEPIYANITNYGLVGQFITGSITSGVFHITFNIKRDQ